jgi:hypothetical protein
METAVSVAWMEVSETQAAIIPTATPTAPMSTAIPDPYAAIPPSPDQQVYTDPEGWYSVNFPVDWKPTDKPNSFSGEGGFFETGYLPEMGYVSKATTVCTWLANIESKPEQSTINWMPPCSVSTKTDSGYNIDYVVYENPSTDPEHRFIYIKTGWSYSSYAYGSSVSFSWLKPVYETKFDPGIVPLSPEESNFWENTNPLPSNISVTEYALPAEAQVGPTEEDDMLLHFVPDEFLPDWAVQKPNSSAPHKKPTIEEQLKPLGYELKGDVTMGDGRQLFRNGRLLFDHVVRVSNVYTFSTDSGSITAFIVNTIGTGGEFQHSFLIQNDAINVWEYGSMDPNFAPILYQGELLWAKVNQDSLVEIKKSNRETIFAFETYFDAKLYLDDFRSWDDHWILEVDNFIVQDGEILNEKLGFQEIFSWSLIKDRPTYFFRKGSRIGLSYDGKILPLQYQDVAHGLCCGFAINNPYIGDDAARFFGKRDGVWYYVVVKFR